MQGIFNSAGCPLMQTKFEHIQRSLLFNLTAAGHDHARTSEYLQTGTSQKNHDLPMEGSAKCQLFNTFQKNNLCDWPLHTKVSATRKSARMQDISDLAGCPWLHTKYKPFEESPLFKSTVFGHCYAWKSVDFYTGPSQQSPRRSALIHSNTFQGSHLFKFDCRWEWHAMAEQKHSKLSNWDESKEPWPLCPPFSTFQKATFATGNLTWRFQLQASLQNARHLQFCWLPFGANKIWTHSKKSSFQFDCSSPWPVQGHLKTFKLGPIKKNMTCSSLFNTFQKNNLCDWPLHTKVSPTRKSARMQNISDLAGCPWLHTKYKHFEESPLFKSTVFGHCYAWESEDFYTGPSQQSPRRLALLHSNTCEWRDSANFLFSRRHLLQRAHKNFS